jgi:hypothetical protein
MTITIQFYNNEETLQLLKTKKSVSSNYPSDKSIRISMSKIENCKLASVYIDGKFDRDINN